MSDHVYNRERNEDNTREETEKLMRDSAQRAAEITESVMRDQFHRGAELATSGLTVMRHVTEYNGKIAHNIGDMWQQFVGNTIDQMVRQTRRFRERESEQYEKDRESRS